MNQSLYNIFNSAKIINNFNSKMNFSPVSHSNGIQNIQMNENYHQNHENHNPQNYQQHNSQDQPYYTNQPSYQNYQNPQILRESQLQHINKQMNALEMDIIDNNKQIRLLNNKITKSDFQQAQLKKLYQQQQKLNEKQLQYQQILRNHEFLMQQMANTKLKDNQLKHSLGSEYQHISNQRRLKQKQYKKNQVQQEAAMISYNQQAFMYEQQRKKQYMEQQKRQAQEELKQRQYLKQMEKQQKLKQKFEYNQKLTHRNQLQTQKDHVYRQYYNHFIEEQDKLQNIYKNKALEAQMSKEKQRQQQQRKQYETFQMRMARQNQEKLRKITYERESLRNFLQAQIEQNNKRKTKDKQQEYQYQNQVKSYQISQTQYEYLEKNRKKQDQRRYDNELATQIHFKHAGAVQNIESPNRSQSVGLAQRQQFSERKTHNPVTNPIDFKIGITNPYVIREYENTKEKYLGDHNLKLRNLAMIGNNSLINGHR